MWGRRIVFWVFRATVSVLGRVCEVSVKPPTYASTVCKPLKKDAILKICNLGGSFFFVIVDAAAARISFLLLFLFLSSAMRVDASRQGKITLNYSRDKNEQVKTRTVVGGWLVGEGEEVPATAM